jgi:hypothetical protein
VRDATKPRNGKRKFTTFGLNLTQFGCEEMFAAKTPINNIAAIGLGFGVVFGERAIAIWLGSTGNGRNPMFNGRRQPSRGGTSRMTRECQVRFCEGLGVIFPGPTRQRVLVGTPAIGAKRTFRKRTGSSCAGGRLWREVDVRRYRCTLRRCAMRRLSAIVPARRAEICLRVTRRNGRRWPTAG